MNRPAAEDAAPQVIQPKSKRRLGDQLKEKGLVTQDQIEIAIMEQKKTGDPIGKCLVKMGFVSEGVLRDVLGEALGHEGIDLTTAVPDVTALGMISKNFALKYGVLPVSYDEDQHQLVLAMTDIHDLRIIDQIKAAFDVKLDISARLATESEVREAIDHFYGYELSIDGIIHELETGELDVASLDSSTQEYSQPMVRLVDAILSDAVRQGASDIHFEPEERFLRLRYRIDGVLRQIRSLHKDFWSALSVRMKVVSGMNIAETRAPQDGHLSLNVLGRKIDFRVSVQPCTHGENIVLRILDRSKGIVPLDDLDLEENYLYALKLMMARPEGIILVTGPTGSGKTTTLYSMLNYRNSVEVNIMTLEDPVEYPMMMIRQSSVGESSKMDFASGIRSLMRQDPDIILVGEIRDEETAEMAFRAAMTGHQVFSTLHTNSAIGVIPRMLDMGIKPDFLAGNIIGILAQRLVRRLCGDCKEAYEPDEVERQLLSIEEHESPQVYKAGGCERCDYQGYRGRLALFELLKFDDGFDSLIAQGESTPILKQYLYDNGFQTLADDGVRKVLAGKTSLDEITRVIDLTERL